MKRAIQRLSPLTVSRHASPGWLCDGGGLYLRILPATGENAPGLVKSWVYRFTLNDRRRDMGLGPYPAVSLAVARQMAGEARAMVKTGRDPLDARQQERDAEREARAALLTFDDAVKRFLGSHEGAWRNEKHRQQWRNTLETYASPVLGKTAVQSITTAHVMRAVEPLWSTKPETASRLRGRIERVLDWAAARNHRQGDNPARWRGHLDKLLPARAKLRRVQHHAAVPIDGVSAVYSKLGESTGMAALALRFLVLTGARAGEVTGARWKEIDLEGGTWTVPADRIKAGRLHRVPLSAEAVTILRERVSEDPEEYVFPGGKEGKPLSLTALSKALWTAGGEDFTVHGFRSTFRDWSAERTNFPREVAEMALAHVISDKVEAAYRRGDL
ncbi:MAG: tyrosine-type recombinase/integrase, partial [Proteobacteria bacterium]|nr:tyrosine-type recombinase/integrase [Pseudomonadota bacterium]